MNFYTYEEAKQLIHPFCKSQDEKQIETQEQLVRALEDFPQISIQGYDAQGTIFYWNDAAEHLYGHSKAEAIGENLVQLILPEEMHQLANDIIKAAAKSGRMPEPSACDLLRKDGSLISVYTGHMVLQTETKEGPEFYCLDLPVEEDQ